MNGQYGRYPAKPGGRNWQAGRARLPPPSARAAARRSNANATALRASTSSNGATRVLSENQVVTGTGESRSSSGVRRRIPASCVVSRSTALGKMSTCPELTRSAAPRAGTP